MYLSSLEASRETDVKVALVLGDDICQCENKFDADWCRHCRKHTARRYTEYMNDAFVAARKLNIEITPICCEIPAEGLDGPVRAVNDRRIPRWQYWQATILEPIMGDGIQVDYHGRNFALALDPTLAICSVVLALKEQP